MICSGLLRGGGWRRLVSRPHRAKGRKGSPKTKPDAFIGEGDVPWKQVFDACETVGGTEWYIVEYEHESQPAIPAVGRCLANLRKMGK